MSRRFSMFGALVAFALFLGALLLWAVQDSLLYFPRKHSLEEARRSLPPEAAILDVSNGKSELFAYWIPERDSQELGPVWFVFGGNATIATDWIGWVAAARSRGVRGSFCLVDFPGYGANQGRPTRESIRETARAAREAVRSRLAISDDELTGRTVFLAHSLGTGSALELAAAGGAKEIILLAPFTKLLDLARRLVGWPLCHVLRDRWDNEARLDEISRQPHPPRIRVLHGTHDEVIPVEMGRALARRFPGWIEFEELPDESHNTLLEPLLDRIARKSG